MNYSAMATIDWGKWLRRAAATGVFPALVWVGYRALGARTPGDLMAMASTFAAVAGTLLGFVVAALSILASLMDRTLVANLRKTGHFSTLLHELYQVAAAFVIVVTISSTCSTAIRPNPVLAPAGCMP
jgi:hypothetical protein